MQFKSITAIVVLSLVVASLLVTGCTSSNTTPSPSVQAASSAVQNTSAHEALDISVHYFGSPKSIGPFNVTPRGGYKWLVYNVTIKDINVTNYVVLDGLFSLNTSDGNRSLTAGYFVNYTEALGWNATPMAITHLGPGQNASGTIVFEVPQNVSPVAVTYKNAFMNGYSLAEDVRTFDASAK